MILRVGAATVFRSILRAVGSAQTTKFARQKLSSELDCLNEFLTIPSRETNIASCLHASVQRHQHSLCINSISPVHSLVLIGSTSYRRKAVYTESARESIAAITLTPALRIVLLLRSGEQSGVLRLLTVILIILVFHHPPTLSSRLKTFLFCKSFPLQPFLFFFRTDYMIPQTFTVTSEHIRFYYFCFTLFSE